MDTPNTRSRAKRDLEVSLLTPGASQDEPRVLWEHDRRFKREFVDNMKDDALPIPAPTQQPSLPRIPSDPSASNRPRKRPCNRNRSVPTGSLHAAPPLIQPAGPSSAPAESSNIDKLLFDYFALHGDPRDSTASALQQTNPQVLPSPSSRSSRTCPPAVAAPSPDHPLPQMSALALDAVDTPSKRSSASRPMSNRQSARSSRETPQRNLSSTVNNSVSGRAGPTAPSPLQSIPLRASQSRRLQPTLSQGETAKSLGPPPRIGLRQSHDPNKPIVSHNPAKAFKSPLPNASQGLRSSPRRQPQPHPSAHTSNPTPATKSLAAGPLRAVHGEASNTHARPSPLRNTRNAATSVPTRHAPAPGDGRIPLPKPEPKMPSSDGTGTGDDSFGSFEVEDMDAFLREVDGLTG